MLFSSNKSLNQNDGLFLPVNNELVVDVGVIVEEFVRYFESVCAPSDVDMDLTVNSPECILGANF